MEKQCQCLTRDGKGPQCKRPAISGKNVCYQHNDCSHLIQTPIPIVAPKTQPKIQVKPKVVVMPKLAPIPVQSKQEIQQREITLTRAKQKIADCAICGEYVKVRESLQQLSNYPRYLQNKDNVITICTDCYQDCMKKCVGVMGKSKEIDCRTTMCGDYYRAMEYAKIDKQRILDETRKKLAGVAAVQTKLGMGTKLWPSVPKTIPE